MSLGAGLTIAASGLRATQTWADTVSRNIANASTEGYSKKTVQLTTLSGGVTVSAFTRDVTGSLDRLTRNSTAKIATQDTISETLEGYGATLGQPEDASSPSAYLTSFRASLETLSADPSSTAAQRGVLDAANALATSLNSNRVQLASVSSGVEASITSQVGEMNDLLGQVYKLNAQLTHTTEGSIENGDLQDQMGVLLDKMSGYADFTVSQTTTGITTVYAPNGLVLVDAQNQATLSYDGTRLTADGYDVTPADSSVRGFNEGSLAGLFQLKTDILPEFENQLDAMAATLITTFASADSSLSAGMAGLFTNNGIAWDGVSISGLSARIAVNAAVDPSQGGSLSLLRDGIGATTTGNASDATQINAFLTAMQSQQSFDASAGLGTSMTLADFASQMVASQQSTISDAESTSTSLAVTADTLSAARENLRGVNIDDEMQQLLLVQQNYNANSMVLTTLVDMLDTLLNAV